MENNPHDGGNLSLPQRVGRQERIASSWGKWGTFVPPDKLTSHEYFEKYLCRIGKEPTTQCHHCKGNRDSAQYTLEYCSAWRSAKSWSRKWMQASLSAVIKAMIGRESAWKAVFSFCKTVMSRKEEVERQWEKTGGPCPPLSEKGKWPRGWR